MKYDPDLLIATLRGREALHALHIRRMLTRIAPKCSAPIKEQLEAYLRK